jgi:hypothetical protein
MGMHTWHRIVVAMAEQESRASQEEEGLVACRVAILRDVIAP